MPEYFRCGCAQPLTGCSVLQTSEILAEPSMGADGVLWRESIGGFGRYGFATSGFIYSLQVNAHPNKIWSILSCQDGRTGATEIAAVVEMLDPLHRR